VTTSNITVLVYVYTAQTTPTITVLVYVYTAQR